MIEHVRVHFVATRCVIAVGGSGELSELATETRPAATESSSSSARRSEDEEEEVPEELRCAVCLELYLDPLRLHPCSHSFCAPCLRLLAQAQLAQPCNTCPVCRSPVFWTSVDKELSGAAAAFVGPLLARRAWLKLNPGVAELPLPGASFRLLGVGGPGPALRALFVSILCLGLFFLLFLPGVYISSHLFDYLILNLTDLEFGATVKAFGRTEWLSLSQSLFPVLSLLAVLFLSSYLVFSA